MAGGGSMARRYRHVRAMSHAQGSKRLRMRALSFGASALILASPLVWGPSEALASVADPHSSGIVAPTPDGAPPDACTVTYNGQTIHGQYDGFSWCCTGNGTTHQHCYNCDFSFCRDGWNLAAPGGPIREIEPM